MLIKHMSSYLFFSFLIVTSAGLAFDEVNFYNVGQGHCAVAKSKKGILIVDAGSSSTMGIDGIKEDSEKKYESLANKLYKSIEDYSSSSHASSSDKDEKKEKTTGSDVGLSSSHHSFLNVPITFIITHADKDHLNLAKQLAENFSKKTLTREARKIKFILGGSKTEYSSGEANKLLKFLEKNKNIKIAYGSEFIQDDSTLLWSPPKTLGLEFNSNELGFLSVKAIINVKRPRGAPSSDDQNKNASSIVVKIIGKNGSVMIAGDKTKVQIQNIIASHRVKKLLHNLKSDILLATHHGSAEDFSAAWVEAVKPSYLVISCGTSSYDHPRPLAVCSPDVLKNLDLKYAETTPWHAIRACGSLQEITFKHDRSIIFPLSSGFKKIGECSKTIYSYSMTRAGIYVTADQGTINFSFDTSGIVVRPSKRQGTTSLPDALRNFLTSYPDIMWSDLIPHPTIFSSKEDITWIKSNLLALENLDLKYCRVSNEHADDIGELIKKLKTLRLMEFLENDITPENKDKIREAWGYRGLSL